jgi:co-chaperonin GroES (HSP10)
MISESNEKMEDLGIDLKTFSKEEEIKKFDGFEPQGWNVIIRLYTKTKKVGSLIMPDSVHEEQQYQGCVGLVVKKSKGAYNDPRYERTGDWCQVGDWVVFPRHAGYRVTYNGMPVFVLKEDAIDVVITDPTSVKR